MSKKVSNCIAFEDYFYQYDTRKKDTEYYFCIYKKNGCPARCIKSKDNSKPARMQHTCETSKIE